MQHDEDMMDRVERIAATAADNKTSLWQGHCVCCHVCHVSMSQRPRPTRPCAKCNSIFCQSCLESRWPNDQWAATRGVCPWVCHKCTSTCICKSCRGRAKRNREKRGRSSSPPLGDEDIVVPLFQPKVLSDAEMDALRIPVPVDLTLLAQAEAEASASAKASGGSSKSSKRARKSKSSPSSSKASSDPSKSGSGSSRRVSGGSSHKTSRSSSSSASKGVNRVKHTLEDMAASMGLPQLVDANLMSDTNLVQLAEERLRCQSVMANMKGMQKALSHEVQSIDKRIHLLQQSEATSASSSSPSDAAGETHEESSATIATAPVAEALDATMKYRTQTQHVCDEASDSIAVLKSRYPFLG